MDLVLVIILALALVPLALFTSGPLRIALGLLFVLFLPGYAFIAVLFPRDRDLDASERIALGFGMSIAIVPLIGFILNYTPWGISPGPVLISVASFIVIVSVIAMYRRWRLPDVQRFGIGLHGKFAGWSGRGTLDKALAVILVLSAIGAIGMLTYAVAIPKVGERFTDFYVLGPEGMAGDYPRELVLGEEGKVILGVVNREHEEATYLVRIMVGGDKVQEIGPISLAHEGKWEAAVAFTPGEAGENQKVEFLLFKGGKGEPYQRVHFWLDVEGGE